MALLQRTVDEKTSKLIFGYVHRIECLLSPDSIIPSGIINIILTFYFILEKFSRIGKTIGFVGESNNTKIKKIDRALGSAMGSFIIDFEKYPDSIFKWRLHYVSAPAVITVGIMEYDPNVTLDTYLFLMKHKVYYGWCQAYFYASLESHDAQSRQNKFNKDALDKHGGWNDIIMILNGRDKTLEYNANSKDCGVAFRNIDGSKQYQLGICLLEGEIEIVDFSISNVETSHD